MWPQSRACGRHRRPGRAGRTLPYDRGGSAALATPGFWSRPPEQERASHETLGAAAARARAPETQAWPWGQSRGTWSRLSAVCRARAPGPHLTKYTFPRSLCLGRWRVGPSRCELPRLARRSAHGVPGTSPPLTLARALFSLPRAHRVLPAWGPLGHPPPPPHVALQLGLGAQDQASVAAVGDCPPRPGPGSRGNRVSGADK